MIDYSQFERSHILKILIYPDADFQHNVTEKGQCPPGTTVQPVYRLVFTSVADWIRMFLGLLDPDPDPLVGGTDPDPSIIKQK